MIEFQISWIVTHGVDWCLVPIRLFNNDKYYVMNEYCFDEYNHPEYVYMRMDLRSDKTGPSPVSKISISDFTPIDGDSVIVKTTWKLGTGEVIKWDPSTSFNFKPYWTLCGQGDSSGVPSIYNESYEGSIQITIQSVQGKLNITKYDFDPTVYNGWPLSPNNIDLEYGIQATIMDKPYMTIVDPYKYSIFDKANVPKLEFSDTVRFIVNQDS